MQETQVQFLGGEDPLDKERLPTPVFLPGEFHGQSCLMDYSSPWGRRDLDKTEWLALSLSTFQWVLRWHSCKERPYQFRRRKRCGFGPWIEKIFWSRKSQPAPVFLPGKSQEQRSLAGYSLWGHKRESAAWLSTAHVHAHTHTQALSESWQTGEDCCSVPLVQAGYEEHRNEGEEGGVWASYSSFSSQLHFPKGRRDFFPSFCLDQNCHGIDVWWVLLFCEALFIIMSAQWAKGYIRNQEIPTFPHFYLPALGNWSSKTCSFLSVWRSLLSSDCLWTPSVYKMRIACPWRHFSAHT